jgi:hypothetical protein
MVTVSTPYSSTAVSLQISASRKKIGGTMKANERQIGSATFGHYWIYIYDYQKKVFRKYNDGYVTEVSNVSEVFTHDSNNNPPTPYFLGMFFQGGMPFM